ncbi:hypothetical protein M378DRAFT_171704 [Amanita muscaria Koide BX008]|uniref:Uncharacterized protein n=1 Tax=Amanita muscaria (strain Koide BX008) TaxID=946122 RepID=A0A0C2W8M8_AMAMK|nr:hypothetical protein M378DRAFT_171704 [Amanita muscaria Koide BX008]
MRTSERQVPVWQTSISDLVHNLYLIFDYPLFLNSFLLLNFFPCLRLYSSCVCVREILNVC